MAVDYSNDDTYIQGQFLFQGTLKKIRLISNNICYGPCPEPEDEVEQDFVITSSGEVHLTRHSFNEKIIEDVRLSLTAKQTKWIFDRFTERFSEEFDIRLVTDIGSWDLFLTNEEGREFDYHGSLREPDRFEVTSGLSETLREMTGRDDLFAFDGNPDRIDDLTLEYTRETKIKAPEGADYAFSTWNYANKITIDRASETLVNHVQVAANASVTHTYQIEEGVSNLLDSLWPEMFDDIKGNPEDVMDDPLNQQNYRLTLHTKRGVEKVIEGSYDRDSLPSEWPEFIEKISRFMFFYGFGEILDEDYYAKPKRRQSDYIFCDVEFEPDGKTYCYLAADDSYEKNDIVLVPAGKDNHEAIVRIVDKNYYQAKDAPFPVDKAKHIIRRVDEEELEELLPQL